MNAPQKQADSLSSRIQNVASSLNLPVEKVRAELLAWGLTEDDFGLQMLDDDDVTKFGDFQNIFGKGDGATPIPLARLRLAFKFLKGGKKAEARSSVDSRALELRELGFKVKVEDADPQTLIKHYLPTAKQDPISLALKKRFGNKKVIAFREDGTVAVEETMAYIADLDQNFPEQELISVDGQLVPLFEIGVTPSPNLADEDPLFPGQPLRQDRSVVNYRNWSKVDVENRKLCRVILNRGEVNERDGEAVLKLIERAENKTLAEVYPEAYAQFRQLKAVDELPRLRVQLGGAQKPNNPFGVNRKY